MAAGRLQCLGSALHLKQKYGAGYTLTVGTNNPNVEQVVRFFEDEVPGTKLTSPPIGGFMSFSVPRECTGNLVDLFKDIEEKGEHLKIKVTSFVTISLSRTVN